MRRIKAKLAILTALALAVPLAGTAAQQTDAMAGANIPALMFENANVRSVLGIIATYGDVNIVADQNVTGNITMQLRNVDWMEALTAIMTQVDLVSIPGVDVIRTGLPEGTEFITIVRRSDYNTRQQQLLQQMQELSTSQPIQTYMHRLSHSRAAEIQAALVPLGSPDGNINIDVRTNQLIIQDYPDNIDLIKEVIAQLDIPIEQIRIEAKLLEIDSDQMRELGLQWDLNIFGDNPLVISQQTNLGAVPAANIVSGFTVGPVGNPDMTLDATISALETQGAAHIVATPSISVLDNATGRIFMGEQIPLRQLDVAGNVTIQLQQVGTELVVTPHVVADDQIIMELAPKRESFRVDPSAGIIITTQEALTNVTVRDGETVVIGGLKSEQEQVADTGIPILMDIPLIGALFRFRRRSVQVRDMILFITPRIERGG